MALHNNREPEAQSVALLPSHHWLKQRKLADQFNVSRLFTVTYSRDDIKQALATLIKRHPALRSILVENRQLIHHQLSEQDWWHEMTVRDDNEMRTLCEQEQSKMRLSGPTIRACWITSPDCEPRLLITLHHLLVDYMAEFVLWSEFARQLTKPSDLVPDNSLFDIIKGIELFAEKEALTYLPNWQKMADRPLQLLPQSYNWENTEHIEHFEFEHRGLTQAQTQQLHALAEHTGTSFLNVVQTIIWRAFNDTYGIATLRLATVCNGRTSPINGVNPMKTVGWLVNYCLQDINLASAITIDRQLQHCHKRVNQSSAEQLSYSALRFYSRNNAAKRTMEGLKDYHFGFNFIPQNIANSLPYPMPLASYQPSQTDKWFNWDTPPFINVFLDQGALQVAIGYSPIFSQSDLLSEFIDNIVQQAQLCCAYKYKATHETECEF